ncbi:hypothetical protein [Halorubrum cibi]|uniref:Uncharacterized protein n=1 Tax=Halorubrum cibi TaxID=413815 RepID=A0A521DNC0_9EURY|nr:hypothetical protein [Halorubrum cibi]SMO72430.1 hypothetical protein SAMN06264867_10791 [Halorubrum cibi]
MLEIPDRHLDVQRATLLPLDCTRRQLRQLFALFDDTGEGFGKRLDEYGVEALKAKNGIKTHPNIDSFHEIATFAAITALRVEFADPLRGTHEYEQYPEHSSERRMMTRPFRNSPGLSFTVEHVREQYVYDVLYAFQNLIPGPLQREIVAILLVPDSEQASSSPVLAARTYQSNHISVGSQQSLYEDRVIQCDDGYKIPLSHVSARSFIGPLDHPLFFPKSNFDDLPPLTRQRDYLFVPDDVVLMRLANYAYYGWYRLANLAYAIFSKNDIQQYVDITPQVRSWIRRELKYRKTQAYGTHYGSDSDNPLVDPDTKDPFPRPDKRLVTVADTIRASSALNFNESIPLTTLFDEICQFFPSPDRPGNDIENKQTLENALDAAIDDGFTASNSGDAYEVPAPKFTPFYPRIKTLPWERYRHELVILREMDVGLPSSDAIRVGLSDLDRPFQSEEYASAIQDAHRAAACEMGSEFREVKDVQPLTDSFEIEDISAAEALFLTRIGLAMERRIGLYSLTQSMASFRDQPDGSKLDVDVDRLKSLGLLSQPNTPQTYYSVPWKVRKQLGIPNVSNDGWGERSPSENTLHRVGIDLVALFVASRSDVDRVVRYCDVWRLQPTTCWDNVSHLSKKRLDVVGFSQGEPVVVAEVETESGDTDGAQGTVEKLAAFPDRIDRYFVTPNGKHLPAILSRLSAIEQFDIDVSRRKKDGYRPSEVRTQLAESGALGDAFDFLLTYRNLRRKLPNPPSKSMDISLIVGAI